MNHEESSPIVEGTPEELRAIVDGFSVWRSPPTLSINDLDVLFHYYTTTSDHERIDAPAVQEAIAMWVRKDMLKKRSERTRYGSSYEATERARFFIEHLLSTPLPEQRYFIPERTPNK